MRFALSTPEVLAEAQRQLAATLNLSTPKPDQTSASTGAPIIVEPYPIRSVLLEVNDLFGHRLATGHSDDLTNANGSFVMHLELSPDKCDAFKEAGQRGELQFCMQVQYRGRWYKSGSSRLRGIKEVSLSSLNVLSSEQLQKDAPISQLLKQKVVRAVSETVTSEVYADSPEIVLMLSNPTIDEAAAQYFGADHDMTWQDFSKAAPSQADEVLTQILAPLTQTSQTTTGSDQIHTQRDTDEHGHHVDGSAGISFMGIGASASAGSDDRTIKAIEDQTGVRFTKADGDTWYRPTQIKVTKLRTGQDTVRVDLTRLVTYALPPRSESIADTPVSQKLSVDAVSQEIQARQLNRAFLEAQVQVTELEKAIESQKTLANTKLDAAAAEISRLTSLLNTAAAQLTNAQNALKAVAAHNEEIAYANREGALFRIAGAAEVWLVQGGARHHVLDGYTVDHCGDGKPLNENNVYGSLLPVGDPIQITNLDLSRTTVLPFGKHLPM